MQNLERSLPVVFRGSPAHSPIRAGVIWLSFWPLHLCIPPDHPGRATPLCNARHQDSGQQPFMLWYFTMVDTGLVSHLPFLFSFIWRGCKALTPFIAQMWFRFCQLSISTLDLERAEETEAAFLKPLSAGCGANSLCSWGGFWWMFSGCPGFGVAAGLGQLL